MFGPDEIRIAPEEPGTESVRALLAERDAYFDLLYAEEDRNARGVDLESGRHRFFTVRSSGQLLGCAAVLFRDGYAGLKRFYLRPAFRGRGLGRRLLSTLERDATDNGYTTLRLETGVLQPEAIGLYRSAGFYEIDSFGEYHPDPLSIFMEKRL